MSATKRARSDGNVCVGEDANADEIVQLRVKLAASEQDVERLNRELAALRSLHEAEEQRAQRYEGLLGNVSHGTFSCCEGCSETYDDNELQECRMCGISYCEECLAERCAGCKEKCCTPCFEGMPVCDICCSPYCTECPLRTCSKCVNLYCERCSGCACATAIEPHCEDCDECECRRTEGSEDKSSKGESSGTAG